MNRRGFLRHGLFGLGAIAVGATLKPQEAKAAEIVPATSATVFLPTSTTVPSSWKVIDVTSHSSTLHKKCYVAGLVDPSREDAANGITT